LIDGKIARLHPFTSQKDGVFDAMIGFVYSKSSQPSIDELDVRGAGLETLEAQISELWKLSS
jgi:hypothetical protein